MTSASHTLVTLCRGEVDYAVAPVESPIEGGVNAALDSLTHEDSLMIVAEMVVPAVFQLVVCPGTRPEDVRKVDAHPHAWAQRRNWVGQTLPGTTYVPTTSATAGAQLLANGDVNFDAALCFAVPVNTYKVGPLFRNVADNPGAVTHFVLVTPPGNLPASAGTDKTTIQVALSVNEPGALSILPERLAVYGIDLSCIESRPNGDTLGDYIFSINIVSHVAEERVRTTLIDLHRYSPEV